jgi:hypothetical protein
MIMPNMQTSFSRCQEMALHTEQMLGKFPDNPRLAELVPRIRAGGTGLEETDRAYTAELRVLMRLRIDVNFENYLSDRRVRRLRKLIEMHDGRRGGRIAAAVMPNGSLDFSRIQGAKQIEAMRSLEARLAAAQDIWPEAATELADIEAHRVRHASAIAARDEGLRRVKDLLTARRAAKERFLQVYAEIVSLIAAEFPRDREAQDLFFLDARDRSARPSEDEGDEAGEALPDEPGDEPAA